MTQHQHGAPKFGHGREYDSEQLAIFREHKPNREDVRPTLCNRISPCWVEEGPPAWSIGSGSCCIGCGGTPRLGAKNTQPQARPGRPTKAEVEARSPHRPQYEKALRDRAAEIKAVKERHQIEHDLRLSGLTRPKPGRKPRRAGFFDDEDQDMSAAEIIRAARIYP